MTVMESVGFGLDPIIYLPRSPACWAWGPPFERCGVDGAGEHMIFEIWTVRLVGWEIFLPPISKFKKKKTKIHI